MPYLLPSTFMLVHFFLESSYKYIISLRALIAPVSLSNIDYRYGSSPSSLIVILKSLNDSPISSLGSTLNILSVHWKASPNHHRLYLNLVLEILLAFLLAGFHPFWDAYYNLVQESLCQVFITCNSYHDCSQVILTLLPSNVLSNFYLGL